MVYSKNAWWVDVLTLCIAEYQKKKKKKWKKKKTKKIKKIYLNGNDSEDILIEEEELEDEKLSKKAAKIGSK